MELGKYPPISIRIANDADCSTFGEAAAGTSLGYKNVVMITLRIGVGSGVIMNGETFSGSEPGHMVIIENGELGSCGRRDGLEAYAPVTALKGRQSA